MKTTEGEEMESAEFQRGYRAAMDKMDEAAGQLSEAAHHRLMMAAGSAHPCEVGDCRLSQEEHHRLAYGYLSENRSLKREIAALRAGHAEVEALRD